MMVMTMVMMTTKKMLVTLVILMILAGKGFHEYGDDQRHGDNLHGHVNSGDGRRHSSCFFRIPASSLTFAATRLSRSLR